MVLETEFLTTKQAAAFRGLKPDTLAHERQRGVGPKWVRDGRRILYPVRDLAAYIRTLPSGAQSSPNSEAG
jgi:hypothetical protein